MDPDELTALREQIVAATTVALVTTGAAAQDKIDAKIARNLIIVDLATAKIIISQLRATTHTNSTLNNPNFCLSSGLF